MPTSTKDFNAEALYRALLEQVRAGIEGEQETAIVGIYSGGAWLAERLAQDLGLEQRLGFIDVSFYRDDYAKKGLHPEVKPTQIGFNVDGATIVLVDDVLYTGRTIRAALDALFDHGRPKSVQLLVLIDRGHRELPIQATYTGRTIPTSKREIIEVKLNEIDQQEQVLLVELVD